MNKLSFDLNISTEQVVNHLEQFPILSIVGYRRSGKSTLAEMLSESLSKFELFVTMQNASTWIHSGSLRNSELNQTQSVDPEIVSAIAHLDKNTEKGCWIVDDAEVMLACASELILSNLSDKIHNDQLFLILIRNRFVREEMGWFHRRQTLITPKMPKLYLNPLEKEYAIKVATSLFRGRSSFQQGQWLASMSGGIPGLLSELYKYTPQWPSLEEIPPQLSSLALKKRAELNLERPIRRMLINALKQQVLPPYALLSDQAKTELGVLILAGMISPYYAIRNDPFYGYLWRLVSEYDNEKLEIPKHLLDTGLNLEIMIREADLTVQFCQEFEIEPTNEFAITKFFAANLYCNEVYPDIVYPLKDYLTENLGKFGLTTILRKSGAIVKKDTSSNKLVEELFQRASSL